MKKINFTIVLFAIGFIAITIFAAFNYYMPYMGNGSSDSIANGINNSGEVFDIEDEKNNFGVPNTEQVVPISNNDSGQIGGASDTSGMLAVIGTNGQAGDDIVNSEQSVTEDSDNSDQTAGNDDTTQPLVLDNGLIAAIGMPPGYRPVEIPFGINSVGRVVGYSGASGVTSSSGASGGAFSSGVSGGTSSSAVSGVTSSAVESETASFSNESEGTSSSGVSETASSPNLIENSVNSNQGTSGLLSPDSAGELILDSTNGINGAEWAVGSSGSSDDYEWLILAGADEIDAGGVIGYNDDEETPHPNPEPATIFLFGSGLIGLGVFGRRKLKRF